MTDRQRGALDVSWLWSLHIEQARAEWLFLIKNARKKTRPTKWRVRLPYLESMV